MRNLYFSGVCHGLKERLEKLRFTEVISYMNTESDLTAKAAQNKRQDMLKKKSTTVGIN